MRHSRRTRVLTAVGIAALLLLLCAAVPAGFAEEPVTPPEPAVPGLHSP